MLPKRRHQPIGLIQPREQPLNLLARRDDGNPPAPFGTHHVLKLSEGIIQYVPIEEDQGIECLVLRAGGYAALRGGQACVIECWFLACMKT